MRKVVVALLLFSLPSRFAFWLVRMIWGGRYYSFGRKCRIGFSLVLVSEIRMEEESVIQSGNIIVAESVTMSVKVRIQRLNRIKGRFSLHLGQLSVINKYNRITSARNNIRLSELCLGENAIIGVSHLIDMTESVYIGDHSILAGCGSQLWTHGFYHSKQGPARWRVDGGIRIGNNVYVGARCLICSGVSICDSVTIGAGTVISKSLVQPGLYVNQALRYIAFDPDRAIGKFRKVSEGIYERE